MSKITLFIRKIPQHTSTEDLRKFVKTGVSWNLRWLMDILSVTIVTMIDEESYATEAHALVCLEPEYLAEPLIKRLHAKRLNGQRVLVKRYIVRNTYLDRREKQIALSKGADMRISERRKQQILNFSGETKSSHIHELV